MKPSRTRIVAIVNPVAGRRTMLPRVRRIQKLLALRGAALNILVTRARGHAEQLAAALPTDTEALFVAGGDGTVGEVINGLSLQTPDLIPHPPLLLFRAGTENLAARELNMPVDPERVVETLIHGVLRPCDLGEINGRRFLAISGIGFDAECVLRMSRARQGHITYADYFWPIWRAFWSYGFPHMRFEVDGLTVFEGRGLAIISNIPRYSIGMNLLWKARTDDGLLDLGIFPCTTRTALVDHAARAFFNLHERRGKMLYHQGRSIQVSSPDPVPIEVDGEFGGRLPAVCKVLPGVLNLLGLSRPLDTTREAETIR